MVSLASHSWNAWLLPPKLGSMLLANSAIQHLQYPRVKIKNPIFRHYYDIIVSFTSSSTLPELMVHELIKIIKNFTVNQQRDTWGVIENSLTSAEDDI